MAANPIAAQPAAVQEANLPAAQPGLLNAREVVDLQRACAAKHSEKGKVIETLISIATLVAGIWAGVTVGSAAGFFLACAVLFIGGSTLSTLYNSIRSHSYLDVSAALDKRDFQQFIRNQNLDLSIDSILDVHKAYKQHLANQTAALRQA